MSDKGSVRLAVVGAGPIGRRHLQVIGAESACEAVAVVDPSPGGAEAAADWGLPHFAGLEDMLEAVAPEGVINATPNRLHVPLSLDCIRRGIPVLVEKPIADNLEGALALAEASEASGIPVLVGHHRRYNPITRTARDIVRSGELGNLRVVSACWLLRKPEDYFDVAWRQAAGGGPVLINLIHDIDNLRFIAGEIASVQSMTSNEQRGFAVEDTAAALLRFKAGALATVLLSDCVAAPWSWELTAAEHTSYDFPNTGQDCYFFAGTEGSLSVPSLRLWRHEGAPSWLSPMSQEKRAVEEGDPLHLQIAHFADVIRGRAEPLITARDAARTLEATLAVPKSAAAGREIELSL
jgi:predicted dehydrogenase